MLNGLDVSHYQETIDYAVTGAGYQFAYCKATQADFQDSMWAKHRAGFQAAQVLVGPYCYLYPGVVTAKQHYTTFRKAIMDTGGFEGLLTPAMDFEGDENCNLNGMTPSAYRKMGLEWLERLYDDTGVRGIVYCNRSYANLSSGAFKAYPLWAAVVKKQGQCVKPDALVIWAGFACTYFQQWNWWGKPQGIPDANVDLDVFDGTLAGLKRLVIGSQTTTVKVVDHATGQVIETMKMVRGGDHIADQGKLYVRRVGGAK